MTDTELNDQLGICLVTGAAGFVGGNLVRELLRRGCQVRALIHRSPLQLEHAGLTPVTGNIEDIASIQDACSGVNTVFHTAAAIALLGGKYVSKAYRDNAWDTNVKGTENVISACLANGVARLVFTSSVDVCFDGSANPDMDQQTPYATKTASIYQQTKIEAEKRVLGINGEAGLYTCALRADGIYGPGPNVILDTVVEQLALGRFKAGIGSRETLQDNTYIDNLIHGEILAARKLGANGSASGKAYFISDYAPQNTLEFLRPVIEALGEKVPDRRIPAALIRPVLSLWQTLHFKLGIAAPLLAPHELDKVTVTHFGNIADAHRDLGYQPLVPYAEAIARCLPYCRELMADIQARGNKGFG